MKARGKKACSGETTDTFYCTVNGWRRSFIFGVNPRRGSKIDELLGDKPYDDWDDVEVLGTIQHHNSDRKARRRIFTTVDIRIHPTHVPRDKWRDDPEVIGGVWTGKEKLRVNVSVAADTYHSLITCFASNHFREIRLEVRNLHYTQGSLYRISFDPEETPLEDM